MTTTWTEFHHGGVIGSVINTGAFVDAGKYSSLNSAVAQAAGKTVLVYDRRPLSANLTVPSNVSVLALQGADIDGQDLYTLTINGPFEAGLYQVFSGFSAGNVTFGNGSVVSIYPQWWGGAGDNSTENYTAFYSMFRSIASVGGIVVIPQGTWRVTPTAALKIPSNTTVYNYGTVNNLSSTISLFEGDNATNVRFIGGAVNGSGTGNAGACDLFYFHGCTSCSIERVTMRGASRLGVYFLSNTNCSVSYCDIQDSYYYGISDVLGIGSVFAYNEIGNNGYGDSVFGRGIVTWKSIGAKISFNNVHDNNEYGIRVYTETTDTDDTRDTVIHGNTVYDNGSNNSKANIYVFGVPGPENITISNNIVYQTVDADNTIGISISGTRVNVVGNTIYKPGVAPQSTAIFLYGATSCVVANNNINGYGFGVGWSPTELSTYNTINNNRAINIVEFSTVYGGNNIISNNYARHYGTAGSGEYGIDQASNATGNIYDGNTLIGFHSGIILRYDVDLVVKNNVIRDSVHSNLRSVISTYSNITMFNNDIAGNASDATLAMLAAKNKSTVISAITGTPTFIGQIAVVSGNAYIATGVSGSSDWKQINN